MSSSSVTTPFSADRALHRTLWLTLTLFLSYLCVALSLPVISVFVTRQLGLDNGLAGLAVGVTFASTIVTRGMAGRMADHRGSKHTMVRGLWVYAAAGLMCMGASWPGLSVRVAYAVLILGRLLLGIGESLTVVGVLAWCFGIMGQQRSGRVFTLVGMALYGAFAVGSPLGLALFERVGFGGVMAASALVPLVGLAMALPVAMVPLHAGERPSFLSIIGRIWEPGMALALAGVGSAAIGAFLPLLFLRHGWPFAGLGLGLFGGAYVLVRIVFGHLPDRVGSIPVALVSIACEGVGQALLWAAPNPVVALAGAGMTGLGCSLMFPAMGMEVVRRVPPHLRGTAAGGLAAFQDLAFGLTGPVTGLLADRFGYTVVFLIGGVAAILGFGLITTIAREDKTLLALRRPPGISPMMDRGMSDRSQLLDEAALPDREAPRRRFTGTKRVMGGLVLLAVAGGGYWTATRPPAAPLQVVALPRPSVTVSPPLARNVARTTDFTGQFSAVDQVNLHAQVSGYLTEIHFIDGQIVHKGDLLYVVDPRPYMIQLQQASAQYQTATASLDLANKEVSRSAVLHRNAFESAETLDQRTQVQQAALATIEQAKAAIHMAQLNLEYTHITAPFTGRVGARPVSIGSLITGGMGASSGTDLGSIVSLDPIHLDFDMSESDSLVYQRFLATKPPNVDQTVKVSLSDEIGWQHEGVLDFIDNQVDRRSGTRHARATLPNRDLLIAPGQFARLQLPMSEPRPVLMVPDAALVTDQSRKLVMTVSPDGTVMPKTVVIGALYGNDLRLITSGLTGSDQVVVNGLMRARPGSKVAPHPGQIETATH